MTDTIRDAIQTLPAEALVALLGLSVGALVYFYRESRAWERRYWISKVKSQEKLDAVTERAMRLADKVERS